MVSTGHLRLVRNVLEVLVANSYCLPSCGLLVSRDLKSSGLGVMVNRVCLSSEGSYPPLMQRREDFYLEIADRLYAEIIVYLVRGCLLCRCLELSGPPVLIDVKRLSSGEAALLGCSDVQTSA